VLEGLRSEENISELCRREGIAASMYDGWSKEFLEAGKRRLAGDTARAACRFLSARRGAAVDRQAGGRSATVPQTARFRASMGGRT
jgi:hypothetical protein